MLHNGWINTDIVNLNDYAAQNQYKFLQMDCRFPLPFENNTVDLIVSSHMLEHLDWNEGLNFLKECYRIMKPNATMRIAVPDTETLFQYYKTNKLEMLDEMNVTAAQNKSQSFKLWSFLFDGHKIAYDFSSLEQIGNEAGFRVERKWFNQGNLEIIKETMDYLPEISIYVEMTKSSNA
jgi:predicted SAM-dependent methyltransferase